MRKIEKFTNKFLLPKHAYAVIPGGEPGIVAYITRGKRNYIACKVEPGQEAFAVALGNRRLAVSPAVAQAMLVGSMFGWTVPGTNPALYQHLNAA